ncbi:ankyrin repeat-containing protein [Favolaschia claudopus]|uniref:Ankyrin repeat-containing protein n=1 Tax=Favolaschia claudopus TaxID=2862362 RepID=A0AAW0E248_9AGAR
MHPALDVKNLQRIPFANRRVALKAHKPGRSLHDLQQVETLVENAASAPEKQLYLPVFMACLDPANIPTTEELERLDFDVRVRIACASLALGQFFSIGLSLKDLRARGFAQSTWSWVWPWTYFMHEHKGYLPGHVVLGDAHMYSFFMAYAVRSLDEDDTSSMGFVIDSTPGFRVILGEAWNFMWHLEDSPKVFGPCVRYIAEFIGSLDYVDETHFSEILDGVGGTIDDLAHLVTRTCSILSDSKHIPFLTPLAGYLHRLVTFIQTGYSKDGHTPPHLLSRRIELMAALCSHGFVPKLVAAIDRLLPDKDSERSVQMALKLLEQLLSVSRGYRLLPPAIYAGLLRLMAQISLNFGSSCDESSLLLLEKVLGRGMVYYHVVLAVREVLDEIGKLVCADDFLKLDPKIFEPWAMFFKAAQSRVQLLQQFADHHSLIACDNLQCGKIQERSQCRRCSGCHCAYYCNEECQRTDWTHGAHRQHCGFRTTLFLSDSPSCSLDYYERRFMRYLIQADYKECLLPISQSQIKQITSGEEPMVTFFDYNTIQVRVSVKSPADPLFFDVFGELQWTDLLTRTRESSGRMHLHVVNIMDGDEMHSWVVPLRSNSSYVYEALCELAKHVDENHDGDQLKDAIRNILVGADDVVEIH